ncbi:hypothetical protein [Rhodococcus sp. SJ-3]|uniref:hypothetical protein n=1 Tax=Rhodococcus sp. SJ-3 TaxID=3454628 RepID=UPI003F78E606
MTDSYSAGSARLAITPSWGTFFQQVETRLDAFNKPLRVPIEPENLHQFRSRLETQLRTMGKLPPIKIEAKLDEDLLRSQLTTQLANLDRTINLTTRLDTTAAVSELGALRQFAAQPIRLDVDLDTGGAAGELAALTALLNSSDKSITARVDLDTTAATAELDAFTRDRTIDLDVRADTTDAVMQLGALRQFADRTIDIRVNVDIGNAAGDLTSLNGLLSAADRTIDVKLKLDTTAAMAELQMFRMWAEHPIRVRFDLDTGNAMASLLAMQAMLAMLAAQMRAMPNFPNMNPLSLMIGMFGQLGSVIGLAKTALVALAAVSLVPLIGQLVQATGVISLLPAMGAAAAATFATIKIGMGGVTDAVTAGSEAFKNSAEEQEATAEAVERAQQSVADAYENAAITAENGAESIERAEEGVQRAQENSVRAQKDLNRAREDAVERIEDLNLALKGSAIDERSAMLALDRARRRLQRNDFTGPDADLERRGAQIDYDQAVQRLAEIRERNGDLRKETEEANRLGVEGSEQVVAAKERVVEADQAAIDAAKNLERTHRDANRANEQAARQVTEAYKALDEAQNDTAASLKAYEKALDELSPNARDFVETMVDLNDEWKTLRWAVQDSLFENMGPQLQALSQTYLPQLTTSFTGLADVLNTKLQSAMEWLMEPGQQAGIASILDNTTAALGPLLSGLGNLGQVLFDLAVVGSDFLPGITETFDGTTGSWADTIREMSQVGEDGTSQLHDFMQNALDVLDQFWEIIKNVGSMMGSIFAGSDETGDSWLESIRVTTEEWAAFLETPEGQDEIKSFFRDVKAIVDGIVDAIEIGAALVGTLKPAGGSERGKIDTDGDGVLDTQGPLVPQQLNPGEAREAGQLRQIWDVADNSDSWLGKTARGFNSLLGYNNETDSYDGGMWNPNNEGTVAHWFGNIGNRTGNWFNNQTAEIGDMFSGPMTIGGKPVSEIWSSAQEGWESFSASVGDKASGVVTWFGDIGSRIGEIGSGALSSLGETASNAWNGLVDDVRGGWNDHIMPAWDALKTDGLGGLADHFLDKITNGAVTSWGDLPTAIKDGVGEIIDEHFPGLSEGIGKVKDFFTDLRTTVSDTWNGLLQDLASGVNHMIDLINWGVGGLWSKVDGFLGGKLPDWTDVPHVSWGSGGGASGGSIPGMETGGFVPLEPGTTWGKDGVLRVLAPGEFVLSEPATRAAGVDNLTSFNNSARGGRPTSAEGLFAMESGGRVTRDDPAWDALKRGHDFAQSQHGKPYQWAGPTGVDSSFDCTGLMASIAAAILGQNPWQRYFYTGSFRGGQPGPMGFQPGLGAGFSIGVFDNPGGAGGGHAAGSLTGVEGLPDINVESSGGVGVRYGAGARGASNSMFPWQFHLPIVDGAFVDPGPGDGSSSGPTPAEQGSVVGRFIDKLISPLRDKIVDGVGEPPPEWRNVPPAAFDAMIEPVKAFAIEKASVIDVIADGVRDLKDAIAEPVSNAWDFVFNRDTGGNLPPGLNLVLNKTGEDEYVLEPFGFHVIQDLIGTLTGQNPLGLSGPVGTFDGSVRVGDEGTRQFQHQSDGSTSEADTLFNMAPEARETFEQNGQGAPGGDGFNLENALLEATGISLDKRPQEERMAEWSETYSGKWAHYGREVAAAVIDDMASQVGLQGISIGTMVTQDVPEAMTRMARLADLAARGYSRTNGR